MAQSLTQTGGQELVHFIHESHPEIKLALITEDALIESSDPDIDAVLCADGRDLSGPVRRLVGSEQAARK